VQKKDIPAGDFSCEDTRGRSTNFSMTVNMNLKQPLFTPAAIPKTNLFFQYSQDT